MRLFAKKLASEWRRLRLPRTETTVIAAISGGADSVSLLAALHELQTAQKLHLKIIVAHFNHRLRGPESDGDAAFVQNLAASFDLEFICGSPASNLRCVKSNLEQAARRARYDFLQETADKFQALMILTGHTLDDQAETFLLRLIRGSGADGLGAMKTISELESKTQNPKSKIRLVRPLLGWARREITEDYCRKLGLEFRLDKMNEDERFARVRVRKQLLPFLKTFNPKIVETISKTANLLREDAEELNKEAQKILNKSDFQLLTTEIFEYSSAVRMRLLRLWLKRERGSLRRIETKHLEAIETLILNKKGGRLIELPGGGIVRRQNEKLIFARQVEKTRLDL